MIAHKVFSSGSKLAIRHSFDLAVFEAIYPFNALTGRALYKVRDQKTHLFYALKIFSLDLNDRREIEREILSMNKADLGNIVPKCRALSVEGNEARLLMDWVEGKTFAQEYALPLKDYYDLRNRVTMLQELCFAVDKIHAHQIFHRDLKPENIILSSDSGPGTKVRLIDFGLSNVKRQNSEGSACRAPEQDGRRDFNLRAQVDVFALGKIGWWLITGNLPQLYENEDTCGDWDNLEGLDLNNECPLAAKSLGDVLKTALAYSPEKRYRHARHMAMALKNAKLKEG